MASKDLVSEEVLQELTNKIQEIVNNYCWNIEHFTDDEVEGFFDGTQQEIDYYNSLIKDDVVSKNFLHSSKQIADDIAQSILEANEYTDSLLKNISSIQLKYVTSLPTSDISEHTIYILKASDGSSKDTLNLYNATDGWTTIGDFSISLDDYYDKTEIDTKMDLKANKTEVVANDKIVQTLGSTTNSSDTVLSTNGLQVEMDKKANDDEVVKKTDITTTIDSTVTDEQIASARAVLNSKSAKRINESINPENYEVGVWFAEGHDSILLSTSDGHPCSEWHIGYVVTGYEVGDGTGYKIILAIAMSGNCYIKVQGWDTWTKWQRLCSTSAGDVPWTSLTPTSVLTRGIIRYRVKNGICYVKMDDIISTTMSTNGQTLVTGLPKPEQGIAADAWYSLGSNANSSSASFQNLLVNVTGNGNIINHCGVDNISYFGSFSYPVAEE